jgi:hypothetical protein
MTKDEALKLALEALECLKRDFAADQFEWEISDEAITAIKQARSAPVQEPVAWRWKNNGEDKWLNEYVYLDRGGPDCPEECEPLYITPPAAQRRIEELEAELMQMQGRELKPQMALNKPAAQRQWVGLTDEERDEICLGDESIARSIEAKLRDKNGGNHES